MPIELYYVSNFDVKSCCITALAAYFQIFAGCAGRYAPAGAAGAIRTIRNHVFMGR